MAEINGEFPKCTETRKKSSSKKKSTRKLKQRLKKAEYELKFQKNSVRNESSVVKQKRNSSLQS